MLGSRRQWSSPAVHRHDFEIRPVKTYAPKPQDIERRWYVVDADGAVLGRLASEVAKLLRGKDKPIFAPHADTGDHVVVVNARGVVLSGNKRESKQYHHHSGYPGGLRSVDYARLLSERPSLAVEKAVKGMLPKNRLGRKIFAKLSVYDGAEHPHAAQKPAPLTLGEVPRWEGLPKHEAPAPKPEKAPAATPRSRVRSAGSEKATPAETPAPAAKGAPAEKAAPAAEKKAPARARATTSKASAGPDTESSSAPAEKAAPPAEKKAPARTRRKKDEEES
jgi:large subunit ribosomal protein L13